MYKRSASLFNPAFTHEDIASIVDLFTDAITAGIVGDEKNGITAEDGKVMLRAFGTFKRVIRKGRTYNVRGRQITVPDRVAVVFQTGAELERALLEKFGTKGVDTGENLV
jgi:nucleoid DNA-binding protein